ncbi:MAG: hypothetical protein JSV49_12065 [Thermoplasmata archaeon]|nr:MAG: hypothetical protein JSV49_12065 [Thermoplasmata archaeon]
MPRKKREGKTTRKIEPYQGTAEVMLKMIMDSDKWLISNLKTSIYAWTIFTIANSIFTAYIWWMLSLTHPISILLIFTVGLVWGMYIFVLYQTKVKIDSVKAQMKVLKQREEDFLKRF